VVPSQERNANLALANHATNRIATADGSQQIHNRDGFVSGLFFWPPERAIDTIGSRAQYCS
jgi:hypothetical protein